MAILPIETDTPLIVDSDAQLAFPVAGEPLQMISRWDTEKVERFGGMYLRKFPERSLLNIFGKFTGKPPVEYPLRFLASKSFNHGTILTRGVSIVKEY